MKYDDYRVITRMRSDDKIRRYLISTYPINRALQEALDDDDDH